MAKKDESFFSVVGYRNKTMYILVENATFDEAYQMIEKRGSQFENINIIEEKRVESTPKNLLVVANAEGMLNETKELLDRPVKLKETFLFLGNYIAPGKGFYDYMNYLIQLRKKRKCLFVKGKNEHNLLEYIHGTKDYIGEKKDVLALIDAIESELSFNLTTLPTRFPDIYNILSESSSFFENDAYIFVYGGLDLSLDYWKQTPAKEMFQTSTDFLLGINETEKKIVFGNIPVTILRKSGTLRPWINGMQDKFGINGDCRNGGKLYGMSILDGDFSFISIRSKNTKRSQPSDLSYDYIT